MARFNLIFTDEYNFVIPCMPKTGEEVTFSIIVGDGDFLAVYLVLDECLDGKNVRAENLMYFDEKRTLCERQKGRFQNQQIYSFTKAIDRKYYYHYKLITYDGKVMFYNWKTYGEVEEIEYYNYDYNYNFQIVPNWIVPDWSLECINYQIFVDRFCNGDITNDVVTNEWQSMNNERVVKAEDWNDFPEYTLDVYKFYGGDLQGVIDKLDYLVSLGVTCIYLNPIFLSPSNHRYDTQDYEHIDPHIGKIVVDEDTNSVLNDTSTSNFDSKKYITRITNSKNLEASDELFAKLVEKAHERNIKVILDGVFNHCSSYHKWFDKSEIYSKLNGYDDVKKLEGSKLRGWNEFDTLPKIPYEFYLGLEDYIMNIAKKWISPPYNADGWRLDVAADLGCSERYRHFFWAKFRKNVKEANPDAIIIAEHYDDPSSYLDGNQWDSVMGYKTFMEPVGYFLTGIDKHCDCDKNLQAFGNTKGFLQTIRYENSRLPIQGLLTAFNQISNHDHARFITRTKGEKGRIEYRGSSSASTASYPGIYKEATIMMYTWLGMPTLYYGDEVGVAGWTDPDNRRTYPWGRENNEILEFHRELAKLCKKYTCLRNGSLMPLLCGYNTFAYAKFNGEEEAIVVLNNQDTIHTRDITVDVAPLGYMPGKVLKLVFRTNNASFKCGIKDLVVNNEQKIVVKLAAYASAIIASK